MLHVQGEVEKHYRSELVEKARQAGGYLQQGETTIHLAKEFGFCYGVERAIDLAYAASKVFHDRRIFIIGEIIHNPDVNAQIHAIGIQRLPDIQGAPDISIITADDVIILPAFGTEISLIQALKKIGCHIVDTTCGDVMSVWKRVRQNAEEDVTSIIHGKAGHEETKATASRALGTGNGHYLIVLNLALADAICHYICKGGNHEEFLNKFAGCYSLGFDPDVHLQKIGIANQTTMLRSETEEVQRRLHQAISIRDGGSTDNIRFFDTICGATQDRQDALFDLLHHPPQLLIVVGGYNSSNTTHLVEIGAKTLPTYFVQDHQRILSAQEIKHYDLGKKREIVTTGWLPNGPLTIGITAGASCPNNLIEDVISRIFELRKSQN